MNLKQAALDLEFVGWFANYQKRISDYNFYLSANDDEEFNSSIVFDAGHLAMQCHYEQVRKFSGNPYFSHPFEVAQKVAEIEFRPETVAAALLHDVLEDTDCSEGEILEVDPSGKVLSLVKELTNPSKNSKEPRAARKKMDRDHLKNASYSAKLINLIDRTVNLRDMGGASPDFKKKYAEESFLLWKECLEGTHQPLEERFLYSAVNLWTKGVIDD